MTLEKSTIYIKNKIKTKPDFGILLLGSQFFNKLVKEIIKKPICISYEEIPNFSNLCGELIFGEIEEKKVVFLIEPFSLSSSYEEKEKNTFPVVLCKNIGIDKLILINISVGVNPNYKMGDVMLVKDHINLFPPDKSLFSLKENHHLNSSFFGITEEPYDKKMLEIAENIAMNHNIIIQKGVYVAFPYPNYKTPAEYAMIQSMGGDSVGMNNIISYVITARYMSLRVFAISIIIMGLSNQHNKKYQTNSIFQETEKSIPILILIVKEFIKFCY
ncbi:purine-nucleoside phosphorylase [Blattabacterium cuenoti]|uniref:purine-nucleoside phosphorylase n=1 Tax=Blattabacterium cuenoti TaxID=1653831 RepID=UPI00163BA101|nr:purine-nucleoside phosphorylase [Blattabacterium cuenoti]